LWQDAQADAKSWAAVLPWSKPPCASAERAKANASKPDPNRTALFNITTTPNHAVWIALAEGGVSVT
jgi:hypothetical protein